VEIRELYQKPNIVDGIRKKWLFWAGHAWRKEGAFIHKILCGSPEGVRPLGRPRLRWKDQVSKDVERVELDADWRLLVEDRERWHGICLSVWS
jgi:hypothetical protein